MTESNRELIDPGAMALLDELVRVDATNIEDPANGRLEKRHYKETSEIIRRTAREWGLAASIWDSREVLKDGKTRFAEPRPNVVVDLGRGSRERLLIVSHYDVVPVPEEQMGRWKSPPHQLVRRENGRYYGRGAADDLGSGVVSGLLAMKKLSLLDRLEVDVRMVACCDEETGGAGGIEAIREHDVALPLGSAERILAGRMTMIPDGSPHVAAGSSGVSFVDVSLEKGSQLTEYLRAAEWLSDFRDVATTWTSSLPSPPEPTGKPPHEFITGRATLTLADLRDGGSHAGSSHIVHLHSNSDAANQIPASVSISFVGAEKSLLALREVFLKEIRPPYRADAVLTPGNLAIEVVGRSGHGGYPHRALNPLPEAVRVLLEAVNRGLLADSPSASGSMTLDMRSPPEMEAKEAIEIFLNYFQRLRTEIPGVQAVIPPGRERSGYFISMKDRRVEEVRRIYSEVSGRNVSVYGEYGGTDASALRSLTTPSGEPMPVVVVGAMDAEAHIHDADESMDPVYFDEVVRLIVRWASQFRVGDP